MTLLNLVKMGDSSPTLWEKEKLLVTSNFSFSHSVFKRPIQQTRKNQGLFGKGLKDYFFSASTYIFLQRSIGNIVGK